MNLKMYENIEKKNQFYNDSSRFSLSINMDMVLKCKLGHLILTDFFFQIQKIYFSFNRTIVQ